MTRVLERKLSPKELKINRRLKPEPGRPLAPVIDDPVLKEYSEQADQEAESLRKRKEFIGKTAAEQEMMVIDGIAGSREIESTPGLDNDFRFKLSKIAELRELLEQAQETAWQLEQENKKLRAKLEGLE